MFASSGSVLARFWQSCSTVVPSFDRFWFGFCKVLASFGWAFACFSSQRSKTVEQVKRTRTHLSSAGFGKFFRLLQALAILRERQYDVRLLAVGPFETPDYESKIQKLVSELGLADAIEWTGFVSDVAQQFQRMDAFVLPSLFGEGLPMVILEAMALGTPVISAEVEGVNQAIRGGTDGLIFRPGDANALADCVVDLIEKRYDWQALRQSALDRQRTQFSDVSMAHGVAEVYQNLLSEQRA